MAAIKALLIAVAAIIGIYLVVFWLIPVATFGIIFAMIAVIAYAIIRDNDLT